MLSMSEENSEPDVPHIYVGVTVQNYFLVMQTLNTMFGKTELL